MLNAAVWVDVTVVQIVKCSQEDVYVLVSEPDPCSQSEGLVPRLIYVHAL